MVVGDTIKACSSCTNDSIVSSQRLAAEVDQCIQKIDLSGQPLFAGETIKIHVDLVALLSENPIAVTGKSKVPGAITGW